MTPRRSTRIATPKKPEVILGKSKVKKPVSKKAAKKKAAPPTTKKDKSRPAPLSATPIKTATPTLTKQTLPPASPKPPKTFKCGCVHDCAYKALQKDLRIALGRPEFNEDSTPVCNCRVHWKCAKLWATSHAEASITLPCGCPMTKRGVEFWCWHQEPVSGRQGWNMEEDDKEEDDKMEEVKQGEVKQEEDQKKEDKKGEHKQQEDNMEEDKMKEDKNEEDKKEEASVLDNMRLRQYWGLPSCSASLA